MTGINRKLAQRLREWAQDAYEGRLLIGAYDDLIAASRILDYGSYEMLPAFKPIIAGKFHLGNTVLKTRGSQWHGGIVGFYSTSLTPIGYAVESATEKGSVQIYPEAALEAWEVE